MWTELRKEYQNHIMLYNIKSIAGTSQSINIDDLNI